METAGDAQPDDTPPSQAESVMTRVFEMLGEKTGTQQVQSQKWAAPVGYVPRAAKTVRAPALEAQVQELAMRASGASSSAAAKKWEPYGGYNPTTRGAPSYAPAAGAGASEPVQRMHGAGGGHSWNPPTGYVPSGSRVAPVAAPAHVEGPAQPDAAKATTDTQSSAPAKAWNPPVGYVPKRQEEAVASEVRTWQSPTGYVPGWASQMEDSTNIAPAARDTRVETSTAAQSSAPAKKWEAYGGYDPKNRRASATPAASFPASPAASVSAAVQARETWPATASTSSGPVSSMPTKKWEPYGGYDPKKRDASAAPAGASGIPVPVSAPEQVRVRAASSTDTQSSAPAKKWEPYTGYDPKSRASKTWSPPAAYVPSRAPPAPVSAPVLSDLSTSPTMGRTHVTESSAPANKWQPYGGYDPKNRGASAASASVSGAPVPASVPEQAGARAPSSIGTQSSAPAKAWNPPVGYVPKRQEEAVASEVRTWQSPTGYVPGWASQMEDSTNIAPAARDTRVETSTAAQSSAPAKKWEAYGGYDPKNRRASATPAASFPASPAASVSAAVQARETWPATASTSSGPVSSMPTKKWEPYGGYDPKKRGASAAPAAAAPMRAPAQAYESPPAVVSLASETQSSAPANQWEPYTGYEPKRSSSPAAPTASANAVSQSSDPLSSAPATRWTPPTGYVPSRSRPEQAAEATQEDASTWSASSMLEGVKQLTTTLFQTRKTTKVMTLLRADYSQSWHAARECMRDAVHAVWPQGNFADTLYWVM